MTLRPSHPDEAASLPSSDLSNNLSEDELASRAGTTVETLRRLISLGIVDDPGDGRFEETLIPRTRLGLFLEASGLSLEDIGRAIAAGKMSLSFADHLFGRPIGMLEASLGDVLADLSISGDFFAEIRDTLGLGSDDERAREDDADLLRLLDREIALGIDERVLARFFLVTVDSLRRVAQAGREMWIAAVEEPLLAQGFSHAEVLERSAEPAPESQLIGESVIRILWNRFIEQQIFQAGIEHLEAALEQAGVARRRDQVDPAIAFLDLTGYTNLTERSGDEAAAEHARELADVIRPLSARHEGRLVKMLGDGAMFHFPAPVEAVRCALQLVSLVPDSGMPPARVSINCGPIILRDADFYGRTVNIAARLVDYARPREVLVTEEVVRVSQNADDIVYAEIGPVSLRGVPDPVSVYSASER